MHKSGVIKAQSKATENGWEFAKFGIGAKGLRIWRGSAKTKIPPKICANLLKNLSDLCACQQRFLHQVLRPIVLWINTYSMRKYDNKYRKLLLFWIFCDILSLNVKMYLRLKWYTVPFFISGQPYKISKGLLPLSIINEDKRDGTFGSYTGHSTPTTTLLHTLLLPALWHQLIFISSVHKTFFQNCGCFLGNCNLAILFLRQSSDSHLAV